MINTPLKNAWFLSLLPFFIARFFQLLGRLLSIFIAFSDGFVFIGLAAPIVSGLVYTQHFHRIMEKTLRVRVAILFTVMEFAYEVLFSYFGGFFERHIATLAENTLVYLGALVFSVAAVFSLAYFFLGLGGRLYLKFMR